MKKLFVIISVIPLVLILLTGCATHNRRVPKAGTWYCEELQIWMDFDDGTNTFVKNGDAQVMCTILNDRGSNYISVCYQDKKVALPGYQIGDTVFGGSCLVLKDNSLYVEDDKGNIYHFIRINTDGSLS